MGSSVATGEYYTAVKMNELKYMLSTWSKLKILSKKSTLRYCDFIYLEFKNIKSIDIIDG